MKVKKFLPLFLFGTFAFVAPITLYSCSGNINENVKNEQDDSEIIRETPDIISNVNSKYMVDSFYAVNGEFNALVITDTASTKISKTTEELQKEIFPEGKWFEYNENNPNSGKSYIAKNFKNVDGFKKFINYVNNWHAWVYDETKENGMNNGELNLTDLIYENIKSDLIEGKVKIDDRSVQISFIPKINVNWQSNNMNYHLLFTLYFSKPEWSTDNPIVNYSTEDQKINDIVKNDNWKYNMHDRYGLNELVFGNTVTENQDKNNFAKMSVNEIKDFLAPNQNNWIESKWRFGSSVYTLKNYKNEESFKKFISLANFKAEFGTTSDPSSLSILDVSDINFSNILSNQVYTELLIAIFKNESGTTSNLVDNISLMFTILPKDGCVWESTDYKYSVSFTYGIILNK